MSESEIVKPADSPVEQVVLSPTERLLSHDVLSIEVPPLDTLPKSPVDAVLVLGMGPVQPTLVGAEGSRRVGIDLERMRHNAIATVELAAHGLVKDEGLIIPTGKATANKEAVLAAYNNGQDDPGDTLKALSELNRPPQSQEEVDQVMATTEAALMKDLIEKARAKSQARGVPQKTNHVEVFPENKAGNTLRNFVYALNELDRRARESNSAMFDGSIALVTSEFGHMARAMEVARLFGVDKQVVPLTSQQVLRDYGYEGRMYKESGLEFNEKEAWYEQMLVRTLREIPEFVLPELQDIADTDRLHSVLGTMQSIYGTEVFARHGLTEFTTEEPDAVREKLRGITRLHPKKEEWQKADDAEVRVARTQYNQLTTDWLAREAA